MGLNVPAINNAVLAVLPQVQGMVSRDPLTRPSALSNRHDAQITQRAKLEDSLLGSLLKPNNSSYLGSMFQNSTALQLIKGFIDFSVRMVKDFFDFIRGTTELMAGAKN